MVRITHQLTRTLTTSRTALITSITWQKNRLRIPTGQSVLPAEWDQKRRRVKIQGLNKARALGVNKSLDEKENAIEQVYYNYLDQNDNAAPSLNTFKKLLDQRFGKDKTVKLSLFEYFQQFINNTKNGLRVSARGSIIKASKAKHYGTTLQKLKDFQKETKYRVDFDSINLDFYNDFTGWLRKQQFSENYVGAQIQSLKAVLNDAAEHGQNDHKAYKSKLFTKTSVEVDSIALDKKELQELQSLQLSDRLARVRDLFLIGCYTGLRFSDFSRLTQEHIKDGFINIRQQKTGDMVAIPVHQVVKSIWAKYNGQLPVQISNAKLNEYLKEMAAESNSLQAVVNRTSIKGGKAIYTKHKKADLVTTHTARRSFATNAYRDGIPSLSIMTITGHKTEKSFLKYIKVTPTEHAKIMKGFWDKESSLKAV